MGNYNFYIFRISVWLKLIKDISEVLSVTAYQFSSAACLFFMHRLSKDFTKNVPIIRYIVIINVAKILES
jgi:hypothetical protein